MRTVRAPSTDCERSPMRMQISVVTKTWIWIVLALTAGAATGIVSADRARTPVVLSSAADSAVVGAVVP